MKSSLLILAVLFSVLATGMVMKQAGWLVGPRAARPQPRTVQMPAKTTFEDPTQSESGWRYRRNQSGNWRVLMMYR